MLVPAAAAAEDGLVQDGDGVWRYYVGGALQEDYTGLVENSAGWWYVKNGVLDTTYTGLVENAAGIDTAKSAEEL